MQTVVQFCEANGIKYWSAYKALVIRRGLYFGMHSEMTDEIKTALLDFKSGARRRTANKTVTVPMSESITIYAPDKIQGERQRTPRKPKRPEPQTAQPSEGKWVTMFTLLVNVFSVGLTIYGLYYFAGWPGVLLGVMVALSLLAAVLVSRNRQKGDTSASALKTVLYMEIGATALHSFTFYSALPDTAPVWFRVLASVSLSAFTAFLSYRAVVFARNYAAEIETLN